MISFAASSGVNGHTLPANETEVRRVCDSLNAKVTDFLKGDFEDERLKKVQQQTGITLEVIEDALRRYT
jgi:hypothetical protein